MLGFFSGGNFREEHIEELPKIEKCKVTKEQLESIPDLGYTETEEHYLLFDKTVPVRELTVPVYVKVFEEYGSSLEERLDILNVVDSEWFVWENPYFHFFIIGDPNNVISLELYLYVPEETVGYVIGKGGKNAKYITEQMRVNHVFVKAESLEMQKQGK